MILRNVVARHGRNAIAASLRRARNRTLSTETENHETSIAGHMRNGGSVDANLNTTNASKSLSQPINVSDDSVSKDYQTLKHVEKRTGYLGSVIEPYYEPRKLVSHPPSPKNITLELLMASQAHMGHSTSLWNPANQRYIYGIRQGIHIISLETTAAHLRRAAKIVEGVAYHGGLILFVGTRPGQDQCVVKAAELSKGCHLFQRWIPGTITNGDQILATSKKIAIDENDEEIQHEEINKEIEEGTVLKPDLVVCLNPLENYICLHECGLHGIPTIGIIDTDADPTWVTYPIPANDDSLRCVQLIAGVLGKAGESGQKKRLEAARNGTVTWQNSKQIQLRIEDMVAASSQPGEDLAA